MEQSIAEVQARGSPADAQKKQAAGRIGGQP